MKRVRRLFAVVLILLGLLAGGCSLGFTSFIGGDSGAAALWLLGVLAALACGLGARALWRGPRPGSAGAQAETDE